VEAGVAAKDIPGKLPVNFGLIVNIENFAGLNLQRYHVSFNIERITAVHIHVCPDQGAQNEMDSDVPSTHEASN
jgi:hypothetical protein